MSRGLLTDRDREILLEEADDLENPSKRKNEVRHWIRKRAQRLHSDIETLERANEEDILREIHDSVFGTTSTSLESEITDLERRLIRLEHECEEVSDLRSDLDRVKSKLNSATPTD